MKNELLVKDVMWKDVDIVDRNLSVQDGLDTMQYKKTKMLIVDKAHENDEYGVCLLYTSPSPRDLSTSRMPSSA